MTSNSLRFEIASATGRRAARKASGRYPLDFGKLDRRNIADAAKAPPRILLLTAAGPWSGVEVHTLQLAQALQRNGCDVVIIEFGRPIYGQAPQASQFEIIALSRVPGTGEPISMMHSGFRAWRRVFSALKGDVVILVKGTFKFGSLAMEAAARYRFGRFIVIEHMMAPLAPRPQWKFARGNRSGAGLGLWWYRQKLSGYLRSIFPQKVICVSRAQASTLERDYHYPFSKVFVCHTGVDTALFVPDADHRRATRAAFSIPDEAFVFGVLGRLSPMKNVGHLINLFAELNSEMKGHDLRLLIVGDGPLRSDLERQAKALGVDARVVFGGFVDQPRTVFPAFDVFCLPSRSEALGIALLEAMACGCPAIASAVGGVPEIIRDGELGWLVESENKASLFDAMRQAVEMDRESLRAMGRKARHHVLRDFDTQTRWDQMAQHILQS